MSLVFGLGTGRALAQDGEAPQDGNELYQFWCSTCHGDQGQGLTDEWRAQWPEGKQNCWQSKCHAANHPPDGFIFPKVVPPVIGQDSLSRFETADDLYSYIHSAMPYWSPGLLDDKEYQAITTFLVEANYAQTGVPSSGPLPSNLATVRLHPDSGPAASPLTAILVYMGIIVAGLGVAWWSGRRSV